MDEVSCRVAEVFFHRARLAGDSLEQLTEGLPYSLRHLSRPDNRIDWQSFLELVRRTARYCPTDESWIELGREFVRAQQVRAFGDVFYLFANPRLMHKWQLKFGGFRLFSNMQATVSDEGQTLVAELAIAEGYRPCREYFLITKGCFMALPSMVGHPEVRVEMAIDGGRANYRIHYEDLELQGRWRRALERTWQRSRRVFGSRSALVREWEGSQLLLETRYRELQDAKNRIEVQRNGLAIVHQIASVAHQSLKAEDVARTIASELKARSGFTAVLVEFDVEVEDHQVRHVERLGVDAPGLQWHEEKLQVRQRVLGRVAAARPGLIGEEDRVLLAAVAESAALALSNAVSFEVISSFRRDLERKVEARTSELSSAYEKLKSYGDARAEFFANVSHELRTPLSLITAPAEALLTGARGPLSAEAVVEVDVIRDAADRLLGLTNQLLDHAALEANRLTLSLGSVSVSQLGRRMAAAMKSAAERAGVSLEVSLPDGPGSVRGDRARLEQVLLNLLVNAVKFTPSGGRVVVRVVEEGEWVVLGVEDTGAGIATEDLPRLFARFAQADGSQRRRLKGTGLGLAVVKELTELHGGTVSVTSGPAGSNFRVRLPLCRESSPEPAVSEPLVDTQAAVRALAVGPVAAATLAPAMGARLLVIEDEPGLREFFRRSLQPRYHVEVAVDGPSGLKKVASFRPDLILCDVMLPGLSGFEVARSLAADRELRGIPLILVTSLASIDSKVEGLAAGAVDYLLKPFSVRELEARVEAQLKVRELSAKLAHAERLAGLGMISAGFAHEVRNPLNAILNAIEPLDALLKKGQLERVGKLLGVVGNSSQRLLKLSESVLLLSRPVGSGNDKVELAGQLDSALELFSERMAGMVKVEKHCAAPALAHGDGHALGQVFVNLIDNALRAMPSGGTLSLSLKPEGNFWLLRLQDSGTGIAEQNVTRLFQPFFTTRRAGEGTGLGLSFSQKVVEAHGGTLTLAATSPAGTTFDLRLPKGAGP